MPTWDSHLLAWTPFAQPEEFFERRVIAGRVVRWAGWTTSFCDNRGRFFDVEVCALGRNPRTVRLHDTSGHSAESRALAATA